MPTTETLDNFLAEVESTYKKIEALTTEVMQAEFEVKIASMNTYKGSNFDSKAMGSTEAIREAYILDQNRDIVQKHSELKIRLSAQRVYLECLQTKLRVFELYTK